MAKVSVIVPIYNGEKTLPRLLNSILNQTYSNLELLLVNDASTDGTRAICLEVEKTDHRVKFLDSFGGGVSAARNLGIQNSTGDYLCFFDSDDWVELDWLETLINGIGEADVCVGGYVSDIYNSENELTSSKTIHLGISSVNSDFPIYDFDKLFGLTMALWNKLYKASIIRKNGLRFDERMSLGEDGVFNNSFFRRIPIEKIKLIEKAGYHYIKYQSLSSLSRKFYDNFFEIKQYALEERCLLLDYWGIQQDKLLRFKNDMTFVNIWSAIEAIKMNDGLSKKEKKKRIGKIVKAEKNREQIKKYVPQNWKDRIKKAALLVGNITVLYLLLK